MKSIRSGDLRQLGSSALDLIVKPRGEEDEEGQDEVPVNKGTQKTPHSEGDEE